MTDHIETDGIDAEGLDRHQLLELLDQITDDVQSFVDIDLRLKALDRALSFLANGGHSDSNDVVRAAEDFYRFLSGDFDLSSLDGE